MVEQVELESRILKPTDLMQQLDATIRSSLYQQRAVVACADKQTLLEALSVWSLSGPCSRQLL